MKPIHKSLAIYSLCCLIFENVSARDELIVYEPFDYAVVNNEEFGRLEGRNGGKGFSGPWQDVEGRGNGGCAFIFDSRGNPEDLYDGGWGKGQPDWDGVVDNFPTMGGYAGGSDWNGMGDRINSTRKLEKSAGEMAKGNKGVLWMSAVWHFPQAHYFAPVSMALTSNDGGINDRAFGLTNQASGIGVGNGKNFRNGMKRLNPMIWEKGTDIANTPGTDVNNKEDNIVILKFEFGDEDKVSAWYFPESEKLRVQEFNKNAISCMAKVDEDTLDTLTFGTIMRGNAVDEIRIGTSFKSVITGKIDPRKEVKITRQLYDKKTDQYFLEWVSNPGEIYGVYLSDDSKGYKPCVAAAVEASPDKSVTTFGPFENPRSKDGSLKFELGLPDLTPPACDRVWGNGTTISLHFTEAMLPDLATNTSNYTVTSSGGKQVGLKSAEFHPGDDTIMLTTTQSLELATSYSVKLENLTDMRGLALTEPTELGFTTWDDNPDGVKVFILAGQSNMIGRGHYDKGQNDVIGGVGSLREQVQKDPENYGYLVDDDKKWRELSNMKFYWNRAEPGGDPRPIKGNMTVGYGAGPDCIGPEFGFGMIIDKAFPNKPTLIIKAAWGGKSLHTDYCSPTAASQRDGRIGPYYTEMMDSVHLVLDNLGEEYPEFKDKGYQISGFGWHQGYNDMLSDVMTNAYEDNMVMFIKDIRAELGKPELPFTIGTTGHGGMKVTLEDRPTLAGQLAVADPEKHPEFAGTVFTADSRPFQREPSESPREDGSHWHNNGDTLYLIGKSMGEGMVNMLRKE